MKDFYQTPRLVLKAEKDAENNPTGMQMRVWFLNNDTTLVVRLFKHNSDASKILYDGERTIGAVANYILDLLKKLKVIEKTENWEYSIDIANNFKKQDEYEEKEESIYFAWSVKPELLIF